MKSFVGWVPNVMGRLSFSRVGDRHVGDRLLCNSTAVPVGGGGFLFGSQTRTSRDGPFPAWIMRLLGRVPDTHYLVFLEVAGAKLAVPAVKKDAEDPAKCPVTYEDDAEGALSGEIFFFSKGRLYYSRKWADVLSVLKRKPTGSPLKRAVSRVRRFARTGRSPSCSPLKRQESFKAAKARAERAWAALVDDFRGGKPTPGFGRVRVTLHRTGRCQIDVEEQQLFTTLDVKEWQAAGAAGAGGDLSPPILAAVEAAGRQAFFFVRDLAHQHYHHNPHSDLVTTAYPWVPSGDETWRRETQYGLARIAIAARRRDTAQSYKQALGLVAYAEAFQKHQCGWLENADGEPERSKLGWLYDFGALRLSIDASLKVRELKDSQRLQQRVFAFGFFVTTLGIIITGVRGADPVPKGARPFAEALSWATANPLLALVAATILAHLLWLTFARTPSTMFAGWVAGVSRFADAVMGSVVEWRLGTTVAYLAGLAAVALMVLMTLLIALASGFGWYFAIRAAALP